MIFAGDFAQLLPTTGVSLYNNSVVGSLDVNMSLRQEENAISKCLWQQVTTIVILKENMHQREMSEADMNLQTALQNMHYASCTPQDITYLSKIESGRIGWWAPSID